jgi:hypothetical protein
MRNKAKGMKDVIRLADDLNRLERKIRVAQRFSASKSA